MYIHILSFFNRFIKKLINSKKSVRVSKTSKSQYQNLTNKDQKNIICKYHIFITLKKMEEEIKQEMWFDKEHEKISKIYAKIYTIVFKFTLPILWVIASFFISNEIINSNYLKNISIFPDKDLNQPQKEILVKEFKNNISQNIENKDIKIEIIQWKLYTEGTFMYSKDNLINYKWYIMPKLFTIEKNAPISEISYFDSDSYDINKLEEFISNIIFTANWDLNIKIEENRKLDLNQDIEKTFNLSCLFENKITDKMCNYYINEFLKYFFVYNLKSDIQWLKKIDENLSVTTKYKEFCQWIKNYIIYSNDPENNLKEIIENCWNTQSTDEFTKIKNFIEIQKELNEGYIKDKYYAYKDLNSYKLLSFQQILYNDITSKKIDTIRLSNYIGFLKNLIKKNNIEQFYKEETYWFNNYFLIKNLETLKEENWFAIIKDLYSINKWESVFGIPGLSAQIKNRNLETYLQEVTVAEHNIIEGVSWDQNSLTQNLLQELYNISFFTVTDNRIISKDTIIMTWYFHIWDKEIKTNLLLERNQNNLIIKSINLQKYLSLTKLINNLIQNENRGMNKAYQYITDNIDTYWIEDQGVAITNIWFCEILKTKLAWNLIECSQQSTLIEKDWINYKIFIENEKIYNVNISNKTEKNIRAVILSFRIIATPVCRCQKGLSYHLISYFRSFKEWITKNTSNNSAGTLSASTQPFNRNTANKNWSIPTGPPAVACMDRLKRRCWKHSVRLSATRTRNPLSPADWWRMPIIMRTR